TDRVTPESAQAAAQYGNVAGSPGFVAPERLRGEQAGPASDLWSLGATLYAAAEGRAPFERESPMAVIASVLTAQPAPPVNAGPLAGLIMAMLAKDPAQRPHPATIRATLGQLATPLPVRATQNLAPSTVPVQAKKKSKAPLVLASAAVVLAVGVTSFVLLNRQEEVRPTPTPSGTVVAEASDPPPPTTQAPPSTQPPKGDGKFATSPPSCDLLTDEQAQQVLPRSHSQQDQAYDDTACNWLAGINNPSITVTVKMAGSVAAARQVYDNTLRSRRAKVQPEGKSQVYPVELLKGTGEQAFVQSQQETYFNSSTSTAWLRVSNVVVSVKFYVSSNPKAADQLKVAAVKAAAFVADNLQKAT
ncbi:MAG: hypothetical protein HOY71_19315, partial [Nonomuraea sp.]|nr:hypothetical protein [Nonomuraea sp.]